MVLCIYVEEWLNFTIFGRVFVCGFILHYLPFFLMGRVLYLHHYYPSLYFSIFVTIYLLDFFFLQQQKGIRKIIGYGVVASYAAAVAIGFYYFSPLAFGFDYPSSDLKHLQWKETWHFVN